MVREGKEDERRRDKVWKWEKHVWNRQVVPKATWVGPEQLLVVSLTLIPADPQSWTWENATGNTRQLPVVGYVVQHAKGRVLFSLGH